MDIDRDVITANNELAKIKVKRATENGPRQCGDKSPFYSLQQVLEIVPVSKSGIYYMINNGDFPAQIKLGKRSIVWSKEAVNLWVKDKLGE